MNWFFNWFLIEGYEKSSLIFLGYNLGGLFKRLGVMLFFVNVLFLSI